MVQASEHASGEASGPDKDERRSRGRPAHDVFVSYSGHDKPVADAIVSRLEQAGVRCWVAPRDATPGEFFGKSIVEAIETSRLMVVVLSGEANQSHHVLREVGFAVRSGVVVVPFRIETIELTGAMAYYLSGEHWLDAMTPPLDFHIANLVKVAHRLLESDSMARDQEPAGAPSPPDAGSRGQRRRLVVGLIAAASLAILGTVLALFLVSSGSGQPTSTSAPPRVSSGPQQPKFVASNKLVPGDCLQVPKHYAESKASRLHFWKDIPWPASMPVVPCGQLHSGEVFFAGDPWSAQQPFPGDTAISRETRARCVNAFTTYVGVTYNQSSLYYTARGPNAESWATGDRHIFCAAYDGEGNNFHSSIRGSAE